MHYVNGTPVFFGRKKLKLLCHLNNLQITHSDLNTKYIIVFVMVPTEYYKYHLKFYHFFVLLIPIVLKDTINVKKTQIVFSIVSDKHTGKFSGEYEGS